MGLVLHSSADGDPSPSNRGHLPFDSHDASLIGDDDYPDTCLADLVANNRHLPPSRAQIHNWRYGPSKARLGDRRQSAWAVRYWSGHHDQLCHIREEGDVDLVKQGVSGSGSGAWPRRLRPHQVALLQRNSKNVHYLSWYESPSYVEGPYFCGEYCRKGAGALRVRGQRRSVRDAWVSHVADDQPVCRPPTSQPPQTALPSARQHHPRSLSHRPPSLERQGAFRASSTTKGTSVLCSLPSPSSRTSDDPDEAELYRLGILYDDEHERGSGFGLDTIVHDAPLYTVSTGGRLQQHQQQRDRGRARDHQTPSEDLVPLGLDLSFANLADDAALARFLQDEEMTAFLAEEAAPVASSSASQPSSQPTVTVIYELAEAEAVDADADAETGPVHDVSDAGDWVVDMDMTEDAVDDDSDNHSPNDNILFRTDTDIDADSNPEDTWLFLRS